MRFFIKLEGAQRVQRPEPVRRDVFSKRNHENLGHGVVHGLKRVKAMFSLHAHRRPSKAHVRERVLYEFLVRKLRDAATGSSL